MEENNDKVEDQVKKILFAGVGLANRVIDELGKAIEEMGDKTGPMAEEGKKIIDDLIEKTEKERQTFKEKVEKFKEEAKEHFEKNQTENFFCTKVPERVYYGANLQKKSDFFSENYF